MYIIEWVSQTIDFSPRWDGIFRLVKDQRTSFTESQWLNN